MTDTTISPERQRLREALRRIANKDQVAAGLGIADSNTQTEDFWQGQRRAARRRLLQLCLQELRLDEAQDIDDLDDSTCGRVADKAEELLARPGFDYALVRRWFRSRGQFQYNKAIFLARERAYLKDSVLRVLAVLEAGGAQFLAFGPGPDDVRLVAEVDAHEFPVHSAGELTKEHREELAEHFDYLKERLGAKQFKVLNGSRFDRS